MRRIAFNRSIALVAGVFIAGSLVVHAAHADAESQDSADLRDRLISLEHRIAVLRRGQSETQLTESRATMIRALVIDAMHEADASRSIAAQNAVAGWVDGPGFFLQSTDSRYTMQVQAQIQFRYVLNVHDDSSTSSDSDDTRGGFDNSRTKLRLAGNARDSQWLYTIEGDFSRDGGSFALDDAWIAHMFNDPRGTVIIGRFKAPFLREELVHSAYQQAVERTVVNEQFTTGRVQGVLFDYRMDHLHGSFAVSNGADAGDGMSSPALAYDTEYAITARGEALLAGDWTRFNDLSSCCNDDCGVLLGAAFHYQAGETGTTDDEVDIVQWTLDGSIESGGANFFAFFTGRHPRGGASHRDQYAAVVQGGFFVNEDWELFARYEWGDLDFDAADLSIVTLGATRFFSKHRLKWTTDVGVGLNEVSFRWFGSNDPGGGGPGEENATGWRFDAAGNDGQIVLRSQLQLLF